MGLRDVLVEGLGLLEGAEPELGTGERFKALTAKLQARGAKDPKALAAWIGRRKHGAAKMAAMAAVGRKVAQESVGAPVVEGRTQTVRIFLPMGRTPADAKRQDDNGELESHLGHVEKKMRGAIESAPSWAQGKEAEALRGIKWSARIKDVGWSGKPRSVPARLKHESSDYLHFDVEILGIDPKDEDLLDTAVGEIDHQMEQARLHWYSAWEDELFSGTPDITIVEYL